MKKIDISNIIEGVKQLGATGVTLSHLVESIQETTDSIVRGLIGSSGGVIILYGCVNSGSGSNYVISAGACWYNGEIFLVDAFTGTAGGGQTAVLSIQTTYAAGDPVVYSNKQKYNTHTIRKIEITLSTSGSGIADFSAVLYYQIILFKKLMVAIGLGGHDSGDGLGGGTLNIQSGKDLQLLPTYSWGSATGIFYGGFFSVTSGALNTPIPGQAGTLIDIYGNVTEEVQIFIADTGLMYFNIKTASAWIGWVQLSTTGATSGVYTPTSPTDNNVSAYTIYPNFQYSRIGNIVHVTGQISITATGIGTASISLTLPVASTLVNQNDVNGMLITGDATFQAGVVESDIANGAASLRYQAQWAGTSIFKVMFSYKII